MTQKLTSRPPTPARTHTARRQLKKISRCRSKVPSLSWCCAKWAESEDPMKTRTDPSAYDRVRGSPSVNGAEQAFHTMSRPFSGATSDWGAKAYARASRTGPNRVVAVSPMNLNKRALLAGLTLPE